MDKLRRQVGSLQEELEESLYAIEKSSLATRKKERETFQVLYSMTFMSYPLFLFYVLSCTLLYCDCK